MPLPLILGGAAAAAAAAGVGSAIHGGVKMKKAHCRHKLRRHLCDGRHMKMHLRHE